MQTEYLIIGSGIAGTLLSYELLQQKRSFIVIDDDAVTSSSNVAGAIINPVTIKQGTLTKDYEHYIDQALDCYSSLQSFLNIPVIRELPIISFDKSATEEKSSAEKYFFEIDQEEKKMLDDFFYCSTPAIKIFPSFQVYAGSLLNNWKSKLNSEKVFLKERFNTNGVTISRQTIVYKNIQARKIIFCEGSAGAENPFFPGLPFTKNRGDALLLSIPGLSQSFIYHNKIRLVPFDDNLFWCGSNYTWNFTNLNPDTDWRKQTVALLQQWLRLPFTVENHIVAERPTTAGQKPIMLIHDSLPAAMFNGLGTKGFLTAPLLAKEFVERLIK